MGSLAYDDDFTIETPISLIDIRGNSDAEELREWAASCASVLDDIKTQIEMRVIGGSAAPEWVYRSSRAAGLQRRMLTLIRNRLRELGEPLPDLEDKIGDLERKLSEQRARRRVADEFMRLCENEKMIPRDLFQRIHQTAIDNITHHSQKELNRAL